MAQTWAATCICLVARPAYWHSHRDSTLTRTLIDAKDVSPLHDALRRHPFGLSSDGLDWVYRTFDGLSPRQKLAQLFNVLLVTTSPDYLRRLAHFQPGAVTHMLSSDLETIWTSARTLTDGCRIPLLFSADLEGGAIHMECLTPLCNQLGMAASGSEALYERAIDMLAREACALNINWSFAPVIDISADFRSAIVGTRSYGSCLDTIASLSRINVRAMQSRGIAATAKHWPGEGYDARDQHLVTTINPLPMNEWRSTFGTLYRSLFDEGVFSVMSAHIALPAWAHEHGISGLEAYRPASVSRLLTTQLLRDELGFNGVVISDASSMGGLTSWGPRAEVLPALIEGGCDMVLFTADIEADLRLLEAAVVQGTLSTKRIDESVLRVLAMKAALHLHDKSGRETATAIDKVRGFISSPENRQISDAVADASPTLVKDTRATIPLSLESHRRVVIVTDPTRTGFDRLKPKPLIVDHLLEEAGFAVSTYNPSHPPVVGEVDVVIYLLAQESMLTKSHIYLDWVSLLGPMEAAMQRTWHEIPSVLISFGQPYYLYDAPRMPCLINAYTAIESVQRAVVRKLLGEEPFTGTSPVDAFCGLPDAHF
jgi:beta-N-acetylhexosaminidase